MTKTVYIDADRDDLFAAAYRALQLLSNPDRVVLDPLHYMEINDDGTEVLIPDNELFEWAQERRDTCRVCCWGACALAAAEVADNVEQAEDISPMLAALMTWQAKVIGVKPDPEVAARYNDDYSVYLTSALKAGVADTVARALLNSLIDGTAPTEIEFTEY